MGLLLAAGLYATSACSSGSNGDGDGDGGAASTDSGDGDSETDSGDGDEPTTNSGDGDETSTATGDGDGTGGRDGTGGDGMGGGAGESNGDGDGDGDGDVESDFTQKRAFLLDNAINPYGVLVASDDKIYVSGTTDLGTLDLGDVQDSANLRLAVWRLDADGKLDPTWSEDGKAVADAIINPGTSYSVVELADGSFVVQYAGTTGVSLVSLSAEGVFGTPKVVEFGWTADDRAELNDLCVGAAETAQDVVDASVTDGICDVVGQAPDAEACEEVNAIATEAATECTTAWPLATAPAFAQRPGVESGWGVVLDTSGAEEKIVVTASGPAARVASGVQRTDNDRYITRVSTTDFSIDPGFNAGSVFSLDVSNLALRDEARRAIVEADGSIVSSGYTSIGSKFPEKGNHIALIRLLPDGTADENFGYTTVAIPAPNTTPDPTPNPGQTLHMPFQGIGAMAEAYSVTAISTGAYVTSGYGVSNFNTPSLSVDLVATAYNPTKDQDGLDPDFGGNTAGVVGAFAVQSEMDPNAGISSTNPYMDRGRHVVSLPDDRTVHAGVYDDTAAFYVITPEGALDTTVGHGTGRIQYGAFPYGFFGLTVSDDGDRFVGTSQSKPRVLATTNSQGTVPGKYPQSLIAIVDIEASN